MNASLSLLSPAKLNLFLHVTGRRADGYHTLQTLFQLLDWGDHMEFEATGDGKITLTSERLGDAYYMCPDERFASQPSTGMCSAWLVAPDIMVSNGHCITSQADCEQKSFVFDYAITEEGGDPKAFLQTLGGKRKKSRRHIRL